MRQRTVAILVLLILLLSDVAVWFLVLRKAGGYTNTELYFFDVGQGDSQLIYVNGVKILIDGGPTGAVLDNLARVLSPLDRRIDALLMTHPQLDHFGGFIDVLDRYEVGVFLGSGRKADVGAYRELHEALVRNRVPYIQLGEGDAIRVGDAHLAIIAPSIGEVLSGELNDTSLVALLKTPKLSALYTGDIAENIERRLVREYDIDVDILKVAHHGSRFSSSEDFLEEVSPAISVIGVGKNTYGHPTKIVLDRLKEFSQTVFRTDKNGPIKIIYASSGLQVLRVP